MSRVASVRAALAPFAPPASRALDQAAAIAGVPAEMFREALALHRLFIGGAAQVSLDLARADALVEPLPNRPTLPADVRYPLTDIELLWRGNQERQMEYMADHLVAIISELGPLNILEADTRLASELNITADHARFGVLYALQTGRLTGSQGEKLSLPQGAV